MSFNTRPVPRTLAALTLSAVSLPSLASGVPPPTVSVLVKN